MSLTDTDLKILSYIEQVYWDHGQVPTSESIAERLGLDLDVVKKSQRKEECKALLHERGLETIEDQDLLSPQQILAANMIFNSYDKRSMREKLKVIKVSEAQLNSWMRLKVFTDYLERRADYEFQNLGTDAKIALRENLRAGSLDAVKYYNEMTGVYNPRAATDLDVSTILVKVMEIFSRHVSSEILLKVAQELEALGPSVLQLPKQESPPVGIIETGEAKILNLRKQDADFNHI